MFHQSPTPAFRPVFLNDERILVPKSSGYPPHTSTSEGPLVVVPIEVPQRARQPRETKCSGGSKHVKLSLSGPCVVNWVFEGL
jgi:hypothetical protein